jgi:hypothetical protein
MAVRQRENGQWIETSYFDNIGGLNNSDSPFKVKDTQATGGVNFGYTIDGAIQKRQGHDVVNTTADTELVTRGLDIYNTTLGTKTLMRAAGRKIQAVDLDAQTFTNLSQDVTSTVTDVFPANTTTNTVFANFNTETVSMLHFAGNTDGVYAAYSTTRYTKNGAVQPSGTLAVASTLSTGGSWTVTGNFYYGVSWHKAGTGAESNVSCDLLVTVSTTLQTVNLSLSTLTSVDTSTYDYGTLWRSAVNGSSGFTAGSIVKTFASNATVVQDTGTSLLDAQNVPRTDSIVLDYSTLPSGTYNVLALWKRRLVTATGSVLRFSELNLPEAWPTVNTITIPSGGPITGLAVISFNTDFGNDEYLAVFKERELWLVKGDDYTDVTLSFIDTVGCPNQSLIALANGFLTWIDYRGIYLWDGSGKPIYCSKPIEALFAIDGDLDKSQLIYGVAQYSRTQNQVLWFVSSKVYGVQNLVIKLDLRLTLPGVESNLSGRILDGVFTLDYQDESFYGAKAYIPSSQADEVIIVGDDAGFLYDAYSVYADAGNGIDFQYYTPFMDLGSPSVGKRFQKVIVWVDEIGDWDLTLDYWAGYRAALQQKSTLQDQIGTIVSNQTALWDVAFWDEAFWDDYTPRLRGLVFHLNNVGGNSEGDCLRLRFRNDGANEPITIHGYTVIWQEKAATK